MMTLTRRSTSSIYHQLMRFLKIIKFSLQRDMYHCPVYKKPNRTDLTFIVCLWLKCGGFKETFWTMRGVALLCDIK